MIPNEAEHESADEPKPVDTAVEQEEPEEAEPTSERAAEPAPEAGYVPPSYGQASQAGPGTIPPQPPYYQQPPSYGYGQPYPGQSNQQTYGQPSQQPYGQPYQQPYGQPYTPPVVAAKDHVAAGLLAIFLGQLGIHKFYLGYNASGFIMLAVTVLGSLLTFGIAAAVIWIIALIEGIFYLSKSQTEFEQTYVFNKREWF